MGKKILFSPIGTTDPITNYRDGSMLHICRVYQPDIVYLYLSAEMIQYHESDNRYAYCIEQLAQDMKKDIEIRYILRPDLFDVQVYDTFYDDFLKILEEIRKGMESEDELFLNIASGTPAMKSALLVLSALLEYEVRPIQVSTPVLKSNRRDEKIEEYDVEVHWELNEDNQSDFENRCVESTSRNFTTLLKIKQIHRFVEAYDYSAALMIAEDIKNRLNPKGYELLVMANARLALDSSVVNQILSKHQIDIIPVKSGSERSIFEYALNLEIKLRKGEYADFLRGITPLVADLVELILREECKVNIDDYCSRNKKGVRRFELSKLKGTQVYTILQNEFGTLQTNMVGTRQMAPLIIALSKNDSIKKDVEDIMNVEQRLRNLAAHEIVSVTESLIQKETGHTTAQIMQIMKHLIVAARINARKESWNSYDDMNKILRNELKL